MLSYKMKGKGKGFYHVFTGLVFIAISHRFGHLPFMVKLNSFVNVTTTFTKFSNIALHVAPSLMKIMI